MRLKILVVSMVVVVYAFGEPPLVSTVAEPALIGFSFSSDGQQIIAATGEGIEVWSVEARERVRFVPIQGLRGCVSSPTGPQVALSFDSAVEIRELPSLSRLFVFPYEGVISSPRVSFSPSGRLLAALGPGKVFVWSVQTGAQLASARLERFGRMWVDNLEFLSETELVLCSYPDVVLWRFERDEVRQLGTMARRGAVLVDRARRIVGYPVADSLYCFVCVDTGEIIREIRTFGGSDAWAGVLPSGLVLLPALVQGRQGLYAFDLGTGEAVCCLTCASDPPIPTKVAVSPDGLRIAVHERFREKPSFIGLYDVLTCERIAFLGKWFPKTELAVPAPSGDYVIRVSGDRIEVWDIARKALLGETRAGSVQTIAVSTQAAWVAAGEGYGTKVLIWNWQTNERKSIDLQIGDPVASFNNRAARLLFSPDGSLLIVLHNDGSLSVYDWRTERVLWRKEKTQPGAVLAVSPEGNFLVTASADVVSIWHLPTGELRDRLSGISFAKRVSFLGPRRMLLEGQYWYLFSLTPEGKANLEKLLGAPPGAGAVLGDGRTLAILQSSKEGEIGAWLLLWDTERDALIHRWKLPTAYVDRYQSDWNILAFPGTRDVLLYNKNGVLRRYSLNLPPSEPEVSISVAAPRTLRFLAQAEDPEAGPLTFAWTFGDGTTAEGAQVEHEYAEDGTYTVIVTVYDDTGASASREIQVQVPLAPVLQARFTWHPPDPWVMEEVRFVDLSSPPELIERRHWSFGDGSEAEGREVLHAYPRAGIFQVTLTVSSGLAGEKTVEATVTVEETSYVEAPPAPAGPPFYKVRLASADRAVVSLGDPVRIVRRSEDGKTLLLVGTARVVWLEDAVAWVHLVETSAGQEPKVGDRVVPTKQVAREEAKAVAEQPLEEQARPVCGESAEAVRRRLGSSPEADLALLRTGLSSPCPETRLEFLDLVRDLAQLGLAEPVARGLLPVLARILLEDSEAMARIRAAFALHEAGLPPQEVVPHLIRALRTDTSAEVRAAVARTLGRIGHADPEAVEVLVAAMADANAAVRKDAAASLGQLAPRIAQPEKAVQGLVAALSDPDPSVRAASAHALARFREKAASALPALLKATQDAHANVRYAAWGAINSIGKAGEEAYPYVVQGLRDPDPRARRMATVVVGTLRLKTPEIVELLVGLLADPSWCQRLEAVRVLGRLGPEERSAVWAIIGRLLEDPHPLVRMEAARALETPARTKEIALAALIDALADNHPYVALAAVETLLGLGKTANRAFLPLLRFLRRAAGLHQESFPGLEELALAQPCEGVVAVLVPNMAEAVELVHRTLKAIGPPPQTALPELVELLKDEEAEVRIGAVRAIASLGREALPALWALRQVAEGDRDPRVREEAARALAELEKLFGPRGASPEEEYRELAVKALLRATQDPDPGVAASAARALGQIAPASQEVLASLDDLCESPWPQVRLAALEALVRLAPASVREQPLLGLLASSNTSERQEALGLLAKLPPGKVVQLVDAALARGLDWQVKVDVVKALPTLPMDAEAVTSRLLALAGNREEVFPVRCAAVQALGKVEPKGDGLAPQLVRLMLEESRAKFSDMQVIPCFQEVLTSMGRNALDALLAALVRSDVRGMYVLMSPIIAFGREALPLLFDLAGNGELDDAAFEVAALAVAYMSPWPLEDVAAELRSSSELRRLLAARVLSKWAQRIAWFGEGKEDIPDIASVQALLEQALRDPSPKIRNLAVLGLGQLFLHPDAAADPLILVEALGDPEPAVRLRAAFVLGELGERAAVAAPALIPLLQDSDPLLRVYAARALGRMGVEVDRAVDVLIESMLHEQEDVIQAAIEALGDLGPAAEAAFPYLLAALKTLSIVPGEPYAFGTLAREAIITALGKLGKSTPEVVHELAKFVAHEDPLIKLAAVKALGRLAAPEALDTLAKLARDPEDWVRAAAVAGLANLRDERTIDLLLEALKDSSSTVRSEAARGLARFPEHGPKILPQLIRALPNLPVCWGPEEPHPLCAFGNQAIETLADFMKTPWRTVERQATAHALPILATCMGEEVVPLLLEALRSPSTEVQKAANQALRDLGMGVVPRLLEGLEDPSLRHRVKDVLIEMGKDVLPYVLEFFRAAEGEARVVALDVAVQLDAPAVLPLLLELLGDEDRTVRVAAVKGLAKVGPEAAVAVPALVAMLPAPETQAAVLSTLEALGPAAREAVPAVRELLSAPSLYIRARAVSALGKMKAEDPETIDALIAALADPSQVVQEAAVAALVGLAPASIPALVKAFLSDHPVQQAWAEAALLRIGPDPLLVSLVKEGLVSDRPHRHRVALLLGQLGAAGPETVPLLMEALVLFKEVEACYEAAIAALGKLGPAATAAVPLILEALEHKSAWVRRTAAQALEGILARPAPPGP